RRIENLIHIQPHNGCIHEIKNVVHCRGEPVNIFAIERGNKGLIKLGEDGMSHVVAAVLDFPEALHPSGYLAMVAQQILKQSSALAQIARNFREHFKKFWFPRNQSHPESSPYLFRLRGKRYT